MSLFILALKKFFFLLAFLVYSFWTWKRGREAGFNKEKLLDFIILAPVLGLTFYFLLARFSYYSPLGFLLGFALFVYYYSFRERWSYLKVGDVLAESLSLSSLFYPYYPNLVFNLMSLIAFYIIAQATAKKVPTGLVFYLFLPALGIFFFAYSWQVKPVFFSLESLISLVILAVAVLGLRRREYYQSMDLLKYSLPGDLLQEIRKKLLAKSEDLESEEKNLKEEEIMLLSASEKSPEAEDESLRETEKTKAAVLTDFIKRTRREVGLALKKIKTGNYGLCEKCQKPIDKARLLAYPEARFCLECRPQEETDAAG